MIQLTSELTWFVIAKNPMNVRLHSPMVKKEVPELVSTAGFGGVSLVEKVGDEITPCQTFLYREHAEAVLQGIRESSLSSEYWKENSVHEFKISLGQPLLKL